MSAATRRNARPLHGLDDEARAAAAKAARRAGMSVEEWVAAALAAEETRTRRERRARADKPAKPVTEPIRRATRSPLAESHDAVRPAARRPDPQAGMVAEALAAVTRRLDDIERKLADGPAADRTPRIEAEPPTDSRMDAMLRALEERVANLSRQMAARPIGRRGVPAGEEVRSAVAEIRARQAELDRGGRDADPADLRAGVAALAESLRRPAEARDGAGAVSREIERLRESIARLATRDEVEAIERTLHRLGERVATARAPGDLAAVTAAVEELHREVRGLVGAIGVGTRGTLASELEVLSRKLDGLAGGLDRAAAAELSDRIGELRALLADIAEPQRVRDLARDIAALDGRVAEIGRRQGEVQEVALRLDGLARRIESAGAAPEGDLDRLSAHLSKQLEDMAARMERREAPPADLAGRLEALSEKLDRLSEDPRQALAGEFERLSSRVEHRLQEALARPRAELKPIEDMLAAVVDKLERAERPGAGPDALDALEKQIGALADRLQPSAGSDPALRSLERAMGDLMRQVGSLSGPETPALAPLERDIAELKAHHSASDRRTQSTLENVHAALEKVVARLATLEPPPAGGETRPPAAQPPAAPAPLAAAARGEPAGADRAPSLDEILLEPGVGRPAPARPAKPAKPEVEPGGDVKASFIAAARRAAQAAAAEAGAGAAKATGEATEGGAGARALIGRVRAAIDKRRRPILFGLAAIVLALGAVQTIGSLFRAEKPAVVTAAPPAAAPAADLLDPKT
ncbi:MAG TPA: hypothetical protein VM434_09845, partial [Beijerinckiaceae bacterium]|nr:hypothetical protein [Beijerinckiaceae bacterium]